jgi:hypothetical protein
MALKTLLREPLLHFLAIGGALFALNAFLNPETEDATQRRIVVTAGRIEQLANVFAKTWQRPPTPGELKGLIDDYVLEEAYYRKAIAMGIDQNDTMIRRRLRQKIEFLTEDAAALAEPSDEALAVYLAQNAERFRIEPLYTFRQIYFNPERYDGDPSGHVRAIADKVRAGGVAKGDATLLPESFTDATRREVDRTFGTGFAEMLDSLTPGKWSDPIRSGLGLHLVRLASRIPARLPKLEEIRPLVKREWANQKRLELRRKFNEELLKDHEVVIQWPQPPAEAGSQI